MFYLWAIVVGGVVRSELHGGVGVGVGGHGCPSQVAPLLLACFVLAFCFCAASLVYVASISKTRECVRRRKLRDKYVNPFSIWR